MMEIGSLDHFINKEILDLIFIVEKDFWRV